MKIEVLQKKVNGYRSTFALLELRWWLKIENMNIHSKFQVSMGAKGKHWAHQQNLIKMATHTKDGIRNLT